MAKIIEERKFKIKLYHVILVRFGWLLIILIFLLVFSLEYLMLIKPKLDQAKNGGPLDVKFYKELLAEEKIYLRKLQDFKKATEEITPVNLKKLDEVLATKLDMPLILKQISQLQGRSGLELSSLSLGVEEEAVVINLGFKGSVYQNFKRFLEIIEKNIRIMDITNLSLRAAGSDFSLSIKTYFTK